MAHNGNLINAALLRDEYEAYGSIFKSTSDTEIIIHLLAKPTHQTKPDPLAHVLNHLQGAYCLLFLFADRIEAARDPYVLANRKREIMSWPVKVVRSTQ